MGFKRYSYDSEEEVSETRKCKKCGEIKSLNNFYGKCCKECTRIWHKEYNNTHKEIAASQEKRRRLRDKERYSKEFPNNKITGKTINKLGYLIYFFGRHQVFAHIHNMRVHLGKNYPTKEFKTHHRFGLDRNEWYECELIQVGGNFRSHRLIDELKIKYQELEEAEKRFDKAWEMIRKRELWINGFVKKASGIIEFLLSEDIDKSKLEQMRKEKFHYDISKFIDNNRNIY